MREVVGKPEIAELLGVDRGTPSVWAKRPSAGMPKPDHPQVNGRPAWRVATIIDWARRTGRLKENNG